MRSCRNSTAGPGTFSPHEADRQRNHHLRVPRGDHLVALGNRQGASAGFDEAVVWMQMLNRDAAHAMVVAGASACTDVTGYGLIGHLRGYASLGCRARLSAAAMRDAGARDLLVRGFVPEGHAATKASAHQSMVAAEVEYTLPATRRREG
jgi:selenophosphate synthase